MCSVRGELTVVIAVAGYTVATDVVANETAGIAIVRNAVVIVIVIAGIAAGCGGTGLEGVVVIVCLIGIANQRAVVDVIANRVLVCVVAGVTGRAAKIIGLGFGCCLAAGIQSVGKEGAVVVTV